MKHTSSIVSYRLSQSNAVAVARHAANIGIPSNEWMSQRQTARVYRAVHGRYNLDTVSGRDPEYFYGIDDTVSNFSMLAHRGWRDSWDTARQAILKQQARRDTASKEIHLYHLGGIACLSGVDMWGNCWTQDDGTMLDNPETCEICGHEVWACWLCLDGGDSVHESHVILHHSGEYQRRMPSFL